MMSAVPDRPVTGMMRPPSTTAMKGTGLKPVGTGTHFLIEFSLKLKIR